MWQNCSYSVPLLLGLNLITMGINATYDPISLFKVPLFNVNGSRSDDLVHIFKCVQKLWPLSTLGAKMQQKEIWYPNKNGLIWLSTYWVKPSYDPRSWPVVTPAHNWPWTTFFPLWLNITKLLTQHPLMSWTKFHYHGHQWHLAPHFMTHTTIVKYKQK